MRTKGDSAQAKKDHYSMAYTCIISCMMHTVKKTFTYSGALMVMALIALRVNGFSAIGVAVDSIMPPDHSTTLDVRPADDPFIFHNTDLSIPMPTQFKWHVSGASDSAFYDVYLSEDTCIDLSDLVVSHYPQTGLPVWNLKIGTTYYWRIVVNDGDGTDRATAPFSFSTPMLWPRMIYLDGTTNVRDIGGRKNKDDIMIRQGMYYRSAEFNQNHILTEKGIQQVMDLDIACEIDLRNDGENPQPVLPPSVRYFRPQGPYGGGLTAYQYGLLYDTTQYRDVFREIAKRENYPIICHCRAGADRAGTVTALLEALLGCTERQIGEDYIWTSLSVYGIRDSASLTWKELIAGIKSHDQTYGSLFNGACNYLLKQGLTVDEIYSIRSIMLDGTPLPPEPFITWTTTRTEKMLVMGNSLPRLGHSITMLEIYSLSGKKLYEFNGRDNSSMTVPRCGAGVRIVRWTEERRIRGLQ
jgi:hypothetical protein